MFIGLDCGNSSIKIVVCDEAGAVYAARHIETGRALHDTDHLVHTVQNLLQQHTPRNACGVSVVPSLQKQVESAFHSASIPFVWFTTGNQHRVQLEYDTPGADRVAAVYGAVSAFPGRDLVVVDAGTAITVDLVSRERIFHGGCIIPGRHTAAASLYRAASQIETAALKQTHSFPGKNTGECIGSGLALLYASGVRGIVDTAFSRFDGNPLCVITGGDADFISQALHMYEHVLIQYLVIQGARSYLLEEYNR